MAAVSPDNLIKHNPAFVSCEGELTELGNALSKNTLGGVGARYLSTLNSQRSAVIQALGGMGLPATLFLSVRRSAVIFYGGGPNETHPQVLT